MLLDILLAVIIVVCAALVGVILLQRSEGGVLGVSSGSGSFMTARGTGDLLTTTTQVLAGLFFTLCLVMTVVAGRQHAASSVAERLKLSINPGALPSAPAAPVSAAPVAPTPAPAPPMAPAGNSLNLFGQAAPPPSRPAPMVRPVPALPLTSLTPTANQVVANAKAAAKAAPKAAAKPKAPPTPPAAAAVAPPAPAVSAPAPIAAPPPPAPAPAAPAAPSSQ